MRASGGYATAPATSSATAAPSSAYTAPSATDGLSAGACARSGVRALCAGGLATPTTSASTTSASCAVPTGAGA